jgi:hypothetical protein
MANSVHLSGLLQVNQVKNIPGVDLSIRASVFESQSGSQRSWDENKEYPVLLTGKQAQIVVEAHEVNPNGKGFPAVVISGRLFRVNGQKQCYVLCKHIQFTGVYGFPE